MKSTITPAFLALGLGLAGFAAAPVPQDAELSKQVAGLNARLQTAEQNVRELTKDNDALRADLDKVMEFVEGEPERIDALLGTLTRSEDLGFTAGINFESREVLLAGWRGYLDATKQSAASLKKPSKPVETR